VIKDEDLFLRSQWNWDFVNEVLPRRMTIGDIDGICVLPTGHFLILEGKWAHPDQPPRYIPKGQQLGFRFLASTGYATILMLAGRPPNEVYWMRVMSKETNDTGWLPASNESIRRFVFQWLRDHDPDFSVELENQTTNSTAPGD